MMNYKKMLLIALVLVVATGEPAQSQNARHLYWADSRGVHQLNLDSQQQFNIKEVALGSPKGIAVDPNEGFVYWVDWAKETIARANMDGSNREDLVSENLDHPGELALDLGNGKMYWADGNSAILRANLDGSSIEKIVEEIEGTTGIALDLVNQKIYWAAANADKIQRSNLDGTMIEDVLVDVGTFPSGLALDLVNGKLYWVESVGLNGKVQRSNLDGSMVEDLITSLNRPEQVALDVAQNHMYWIEGGGIVKRANLDGSNTEILSTDSGQTLRSIALDLVNGKMYWSAPNRTQQPADKILRANLDGSNKEEILANYTFMRPNGVAFDPNSNKVYWTDLGTRKIMRAQADGSDEEELWFRAFLWPSEPTLDLLSGKIYWGDDSIYRANLDGSEREDLVSGLGIVESTALDYVNNKIYWVDSQKDNLKRANFDGSESETLFTENIMFPTSIVVDDRNGKIYWSDINADYIQRANLDGSDREDVVIRSDISLSISFDPKGIAIDPQLNHLYWVDEANGVLMRSDLDGNDIVTLLDGLPNPNALTLSSSQLPTSTENTPAEPAVFEIQSSYPNPFSERITVTYTQTVTVAVSVTIYDILGRRVMELSPPAFTAGTHKLVWDGRDLNNRRLSSGLYIVVLEAQDERLVQEIALY